MADHAALRDELWAALQAAKPVTRGQCEQIAMGILPPKEMGDFSAWFVKHGDALVEKVNA
jgi:hypothetical protein